MSVTDPVCGLEFDESLAIVHEYDEKKILFLLQWMQKDLYQKTKKMEKTG